MFCAPRIEVRFIDLTEVHGVPVVVGVARGRLPGRDVYAVGGGSALDLPTAVWKAARELAAFYASARRDVAVGADRPAPEAVTTFIDHRRYYGDPAQHHELGFLFEDRAWATVPVLWPDPPTSPAGELRRLSRLLRERRIRTYALDLTPGEAPLDLFCYKVVSPELIPLDFDHRARHVNKERLLAEPTRRGWRPDRPALEELNHAPHPFP
jgi:ribosomal protein S12 methylthiotransferase accessory factor